MVQFLLANRAAVLLLFNERPFDLSGDPEMTIDWVSGPHESSVPGLSVTTEIDPHESLSFFLLTV